MFCPMFSPDDLFNILPDALFNVLPDSWPNFCPNVLPDVLCQGLTKSKGKTNWLKEMLIFTFMANFMYFSCITDRNLLIL